MLAVIIDVFINKFNCSKHDVTMASGSQATERTCIDYSVAAMCEVSAQDTLLLLSVIYFSC